MDEEGAVKFLLNGTKGKTKTASSDGSLIFLA